MRRGSIYLRRSRGRALLARCSWSPTSPRRRARCRASRWKPDRPKVPPQFRRRRRSSFAVNAQDEAFLSASPAHSEAGAAGREGCAARDGVRSAPGIIIKIVGRRRARATSGPSASTASTSTTKASSGSAATTARQRPARAQAGGRRSAPEVHAGRQVRACRSARAIRAKATPTPPTCTAPADALGPPADQRAVRRRRLRQPSRHRVRRRHRRVQAHVGRIRQQAGRRRPLRDRQRHKNFTDPGPDQFSIVHAIRVAKDGMVYVADREYRRVQMFTSDGKFVKQLVKADAPFARNLRCRRTRAAVPLCRRRQRRSRSSIARRLTIVGAIKVPGMIGGGHHIATDSKGNIYVAATEPGMQKLSFKGMTTASR